MRTFEDLMTGTRSNARRGVRWTPETGELLIYRNGRATRYSLTETYVPASYGAGRAFRLRKDDGTVYDLFLADDRPASSCDCPGCSYAATARADQRHGDRTDSLGCCHLDAVQALIWNGWLPDPRTNPDADVGGTEPQEQELPDCFRSGFGTGTNCPF